MTNPRVNKLLLICEELGSEYIYKLIKRTLEGNGIDMNNIIGFGSDGANAMRGKNQSVLNFQSYHHFLS